MSTSIAKRMAKDRENRKVISDALIAGERIHSCMHRGSTGLAIQLANDDIKLAELYTALICRFVELMKKPAITTIYAAIDQLMIDGWHKKIQKLIK